MRRKKPLRQTGVFSSDTLKNFSDGQLRGIGAVAMTYNAAETKLHEIVGECINFPGDSHEIVSRINGTDGMIAIIQAAVPLMNLPPDFIACLKLALVGEGFSQLKTYRDGVIHARVYDAASGVGRAPGARGSRDDVLLSEKALTWLTKSLDHLTHEMEGLVQGMRCARRLQKQPAPDDQHRARLQQCVLEAIAQCQDHQRQRGSLRPHPKFPENRETSL